MSVRLAAGEMGRWLWVRPRSKSRSPSGKTEGLLTSLMLAICDKNNMSGGKLTIHSL